MQIVEISKHYIKNGNVFASGTQPNIARLSDNQFIITWVGQSGYTDGNGSGIFAQQFSASGDAIGSAFLVNTTKPLDQTNPSVAGLANGGFVISWVDASLTGGDSSGSSIKGQLFTADGAANGREFLVNTTTLGSQVQPKTTALDNGGYIITWRDGTTNAGGNGPKIYAQFYSQTGAKVGSELVLITGQITDYEIAKTEDGRLVVCWVEGSNSTDAKIFFQIFDDNGVKTTTAQDVVTYQLGEQRTPEIIPLKTGGFTITWSDTSGSLGDSNGSVKAQIFDSTGKKVGSEFLVNTETNNNQLEPQGVSLGEDFVISWVNHGSYSLQAFAYDGYMKGRETGSSIIPTETSSYNLEAAAINSERFAIVNGYGGNVTVTLFAYGSPPKFISGGGLTNTSYGVDENIATVSVISATSVTSRNPLAYSIIGGADAQLFELGSSDGVLRFKVAPDYETPKDANRNNDYEVKVRASDGVFYDDQTILVEVRNKNDAPTFSSASRSVAATAGTLKLVTLTASDQDNDTLTYTASSPIQGSVKIVGGELAYTPSISASGTETVTVTAADGKGGTATQIINFTITSVNAAPTFSLVAQSLATNEDTAKTIVVAATDLNNDVLTYSVSSLPQQGTTNVSGSTVTYTPKANYNGSDSFVVTASDGKGGIATQTVNVTVTAVNDAPTFSASSQSVSATAGAAKTVTLDATDVDGDALTYTFTTPSKGSATISGSTLTYTPTSSASGADSFVVTARDPSGATATQTINITVAGSTATTSTTDFRVTASDGWTGAIGGNGLVYGTSGYQDVKVLSGTVTFDASFNKGGDIVRFDAAASSYSVTRVGSSAQISAGSNLSAVIPVGTAGMVASFSDGARKLVFANSNFALGAQTFSTSSTTISAAADGTSLPIGANSSASARISLAGNDLRAGQNSHITIGGKAIIYGNAAKADVVAIASGVNVDLTFDASFNRGGDTIILDKSAGSYSAIRSGASIILTSTSQTLTIPVGTSNTTIKFADDSRALVYSTSEGAIKLGTQTIATTSTAILPSSVTTSLDVGTSSSTTTVSGANGKVIFTDDATKSSYVKITNFGSDDIIRVTGATEDKYSFTNADLDGDGQADDLSITFSNPDAGVVNDIQIINAVSSTAFIADKASAISAVGFNFISFG